MHQQCAIVVDFYLDSIKNELDIKFMVIKYVI